VNWVSLVFYLMIFKGVYFQALGLCPLLSVMDSGASYAIPPSRSRLQSNEFVLGKETYGDLQNRHCLSGEINVLADYLSHFLRQLSG
jgi:hypothetical protein